MRRYEQCDECGHSHYDTFVGAWVGCPLFCDCHLQPVVVEDGVARYYPIAGGEK